MPEPCRLFPISCCPAEMPLGGLSPFNGGACWAQPLGSEGPLSTEAAALTGELLLLCGPMDAPAVPSSPRGCHIIE